MITHTCILLDMIDNTSSERIIENRLTACVAQQYRSVVSHDVGYCDGLIQRIYRQNNDIKRFALCYRTVVLSCPVCL